jgi:hypothetical protein
MKRVLFDLVLFGLIFTLFLSGSYEQLPPPLQLLSLKIMLVSAGLLTAHIGRKVVFPYVDLNKPFVNWAGGHYVAISFYIIIPLCFALGG